MPRNIAKPFHTTLSIIDINTVQPKYKCFYTEDVQLFIKVIDEFKKPLNISNVNVKAFFINEGDDLRQDDRITITNAENGEFNILVRKNYIRLGLNTVRVVLFDADQEVFLQPFQIHCISSEILDDSIIIADDDYNVRDEVSKINSKIDTEVDKLESSLETMSNNFQEHIDNHPTGETGGGVSLGETSTTAYRGDRGKIAYDHSQVTHAPTTAQKNSDITKAEIEAKLTGVISTHTHSGTTNNKLNNKKWCAIGDSITALTYHSAKNYHGFVADRNGCSIYNHGKDGWTIVQLVSEVANCEGDSDIVTLFAGTNDWHIGTQQFGEFLDVGTTTVCGAINEILKALISKFGNKSIMVFSPLQRYQNEQYGLNANVNNRNYTLLQLVDMLKKTCEHYSIPFFDLYRQSGFHMSHEISRNEYFTDGLHPNIKGHEQLSYIFQDFIERNIKMIQGTLSPITYGEIVLNKTSLTIAEGGTGTFTVALDKAPTNNQVITLSKTNTDVTLSATSLTFTPSNYATPQTVTITVAEDNTDYSNESDTITLTSPNVVNKTVSVTITDNDTAPVIDVTGVTLNKSTTTINVGSTDTLSATISPTNATNKNVTWVSSDTNIATVNATGLVTSVTEGSATITCTAQDTTNGTKSDSCNVTVLVYQDGFTGKTFTGTGIKSNPYNFTTVIGHNNLVSGDIIKIEYDFSEAVNTVSKTSGSVQLFKSNNNTVSDGSYNGTCSSMINNIINWTNNATSGVLSYTANANVTSGFIRIPICIGTPSAPFSFKINNLKVYKNNVGVVIENIGGFFSEETFTIS